jgi:anti-anti-sigma regulatory factor
MLKITTVTERQSTTLQLEGRLAGAWVQELEGCWMTALRTRATDPLVVDLSGVTYIDAQGKDLLKKIYQAGAEMVASGCLTGCVVAEITKDLRNREGAK